MHIVTFQSEKGKAFVHWLESFYRSTLYIYIVAGVTALSCIFGLEAFCYLFYTIVGLLIPFLFLDELPSILAPFFFGYFSVSLKHNQSEAGHSIFQGSLGILIWVLVSLLLLMFVIRTVLAYVKKKAKPLSKNFYGMVVFGMTMVLGGIFSPFYKFHSSVYALAVLASFLVVYFLAMQLSGLEHLSKDYFFHILTGLGLLLCVELLSIFIQNIDVFFSGNFHDGYIRTGWGISNTIGAMLVCSLPGPLYFATKSKVPLGYLLLNLFFLVAALATQSRNAMFCGFVSEIVLLIIYFVHAKSKANAVICYAAILLFVTFIGFLFKEQFDILFKDLIYTLKNWSLSYIANGRLTLYKTAWQAFTNYPIFGEGFYIENGDNGVYYFTYDFIPYRMHNTYFQILGSFGLVGALGYLYHRIITLSYALKNRTKERWFLFGFFFCILSISVFDCHFFNLGPGLLYGIGLAFLETDYTEKRRVDYLHSYLDSF